MHAKHEPIFRYFIVSSHLEVLGSSPVDWFLSSNSWRSLYTHPTITDPIKKKTTTTTTIMLWKKKSPFNAKRWVSLNINIFEMVFYQFPIRLLSPKNYSSYTTAETKLFSKTKQFSSTIIFLTYFLRHLITQLANTTSLRLYRSA